MSFALRPEALTELLALGPGPQSSTDKLGALFTFLRTYRSKNGREALMFLAVRPLLGMVELPADPAEADAVLDAGAQLLLALKSDPLPAPGQLPLAPAIDTTAEATP